MRVVYDCYVPEVMGYPQRGYRFQRGDDVFLMSEGCLSEIMGALWSVCGWEPDPDEPNQPNLSHVPLLVEWNDCGTIGTQGPIQILELASTARAFQNVLGELQSARSSSPQHAEALVRFLEQAVTSEQSVSVEEWWGE